MHQVSRKVLFLFLLLLNLTIFTKEQYQQCTYYSGSLQSGTNPIFGEVGQFDEENTIGGIAFSTSFLVSNDSEIIVGFGYRASIIFLGASNICDQIWSYSLTKKQWRFLKGRESYNQDATWNVVGDFDEATLAGARYSAGGWKENEEVVTFFGGEGYLSTGKKTPTNEIFRYNVTSNLLSIVHYNHYTNSSYNNVYTQYSGTPGVFSDLNFPGGRRECETLRINSDEILMFGGYGYTTSSTSKFLEGFWIYSTSLNQWKYLTGSLTTENVIVLGDQNVYAPTNRMGGRTHMSAVLVNDEEVVIFGGVRHPDPNESDIEYLNIVQKFNISSNQFKYLSGKLSDDPYGEGYSRTFNETNLPGGRKGSKIIKVKDNELLLFAGYGYSLNDNSGHLVDEWRFNLDSNLWMFSGKEKTKYEDRYLTVSKNAGYSADTLLGGTRGFSLEHVESRNEMIVLVGWGHDLNEKGFMDDVFRFFLGNQCNLYEDTDPEVCSKKGECIDYNLCQCNDAYGSDCELTKCFDHLSNETGQVCSGNGFCIDGSCLCFDQSYYVNPDCSIDENLKNFVDNIWLMFVIPIVIVIILGIFIALVVGFILIYMKFRKVKGKIEGIEDIDIILNEAKLEQQSKNPKIKVNRSLFEIDYADLELVSVIGQGGSQTQIFLAKWKNNYCAYKGFKKTNILDTQLIYDEFEKEVKIFSSIRHPSILQFYGACVSPPNIGIVLEYCRNGDLSQFISKYHFNRKEKYPPHEKVRIINEIAQGMEFLHSINVLHRDLKPENVLIDDNENSKIMDFGLSKVSKIEDKTRTAQIGTSSYMAPEVFLGGKYWKKCDVFSFAMLSFVLITENFNPFGENSYKVSVSKKIAQSSDFRPTINRRDFEGCEFLIPLIKKNWDDEPDNRDDFKSIIQYLEKNKIKKNQKKQSKIELNEVLKELDKSKSIIKMQKKEIDNLKLEIQILKKKGNPNNFHKSPPPKPPQKKQSRISNNQRRSLRFRPKPKPPALKPKRNSVQVPRPPKRF